MMRWTSLIIAGALIGPTLLNAQEDDSPRSYLDLRPANVSYSRGMETIEATPVEFYVLEGPVDVVLSTLTGYVINDKPPAGVSCSFRHRAVPAWMDFSLYPMRSFPIERSTADAEKHIAAVTAAYAETHDVETVFISDPAERVYERYFGQKPFDVVYQLTEKTPEGVAPPEPYIFHETWVPLDDHMLVITLKAQQSRYRGLLNQARRIWRDGSFR